MAFFGTGNFSTLISFGGIKIGSDGKPSANGDAGKAMVLVVVDTASKVGDDRQQDSPSETDMNETGPETDCHNTGR